MPGQNQHPPPDVTRIPLGKRKFGSDSNKISGAIGDKRDNGGSKKKDMEVPPSSPPGKRMFGNDSNETSEAIDSADSNRADNSSKKQQTDLSPCRHTPCIAHNTPRPSQNSLAGYELQPCAAPEIRSIAQQKKDWSGWALAANEGDIFEHILHRVDCKSIIVNDILCYDDEEMGNLKECYGVLFLMPFNEDYETQDGEDLEDLPEKMWFANQIAENACGSYGLLNIVMNLPDDVEIGQLLQNLKEFSCDMHPKLRGECVASFKSIKDAHNSFCARYEMEDCDFSLYEQATEEPPRRLTKARQAKLEEESVDELDKPFHYIAYVRFDGFLWELDGLKQTPFKVCACDGDNFTISIGARLRELTSRFPDQYLEFSALSLCAVKAPRLTEERTGTVHKLGAIDEILLQRDPAFSQVVEKDLLNGTYFGKPPVEKAADLEQMATVELLDIRLAQITIQREIDDALTEVQREAERRVWSVAQKQHDYEPFLLEMASAGLEGYLADHPPRRARGKVKAKPTTKNNKEASKANPKSKGKSKK